MEFLVLAFVFDNYDWFAFGSLLDFEWPMFHVCLDNGVIEFAADQTLGVENSVVRIFGSLVFGCISNQPFSFCKGDIRRSGSISLIIGDNLDSIILPNTNTGVGST